MQTWPEPAFPFPAFPGPALELVDSASGIRRSFDNPETFTVYVCGITPYDATHMGHAFTYVSFDLLVRYLTAGGTKVTYAQNVTDIDDPLLERAAATGVDWEELAVSQVELFASDMAALSVIPPNHYLGVVETIEPIAHAAAKLLAQGAAYWVDTDVYADLSKDPDFGSLSGFSAELMSQLFAERGGDPDRPGKRQALDPLLWRGQRPGEPHWDGGVLGQGRPGWHIECTVIAQQTIGLPFDLQGGGTDLLFPHQEMGSSHGRILSGAPAGAGQHTMLSGMVALDGEKMSKSLGNLELVSRLRGQGVDPAAIRLVLVSQHYSSDWEWTGELLSRAQQRLSRWRDASGVVVPQNLITQLRAALADNLNSPVAVSVVDGFVADPLAGSNSHGLTLGEVVFGLLGVNL